MTIENVMKNVENHLRNYPEMMFPWIQLLEETFEGAYLIDLHRKILFWNKAAAKITGYAAEEVVGSRCRDDILVHVDKHGKSICSHSCPILKSFKTKEKYETEIYLHHKEGFRIPVEVRVIPLLDENQEPIGAVEYFREHLGARDISEELMRLSRLSLLDPLTELGNRRFVNQKIENALSQLSREEQKFGLIFIDIDHFKNINDKFGHKTGDNVLKMVAHTLKRNVRIYDSVGRWGGEEFICVLENTNSEKLANIAEKLRSLVESSFIEVEDKRISVTISSGATMAVYQDSSDSIIKRVDSLMYKAKNSGRNRVVVG